MASPTFSGREALELILELPLEQRRLFLARRLEAYRDAVVQYSAALIRTRGGKQTVAEAESQAAIETDGFTKLVPLESPLYPLLLGE